jgi:hypothetical protein
VSRLFVPLAVGFAFLVFGLWHGQARGNLSGCCKERSSYDSGWSENGMGFGECDEVNNDRDGDPIFQPTGLIWWDRSCQ